MSPELINLQYALEDGNSLVEDALAIAEDFRSFGSMNASAARQVALADEVSRLRILCARYVVSLADLHKYLEDTLNSEEAPSRRIGLW